MSDEKETQEIEQSTEIQNSTETSQQTSETESQKDTSNVSHETKKSEEDLMLEQRVRAIEEREEQAKLRMRINDLPKEEQEFAQGILQGLNVEQQKSVLGNFEKKIAERSVNRKPPQDEVPSGDLKRKALEECFVKIKAGDVDACRRFEKICGG